MLNVKANPPEEEQLLDEMQRILWISPHCTHKDYNHPNAWGTKIHIGHPNRNVVMKMIEQVSSLLE